MSTNKKKHGFLITFSRHLFLLLMALGIVFLLFNLLVDWSDLTDYFPTPVLGDELFYYRIVDGFTHYGFLLGNNGVSYNEVSANLGPFSAHGPFYIYFYSVVAHILGWSPFIAITTNIFIISFAVYALLVAKIKVETAILLAIVFLFYFPFTLFFPYFMMETFNHFIMMILFLILVRFLTDPEIASFNHIILIFLTVFVASLFRVTYFVFYFAIIAYAWKNIVFHERASLLFLALLLTVLAYFAINNLSSPYPNFMSQKIDLLINLEVFNFFNDICVRFLNNLHYLATSSSRIDKGFFSLYLLSFVWAMINISRNRLYLFVSIVLIFPFFIVFSLYDVDFFIGH